MKNKNFKSITLHLYLWILMGVIFTQVFIGIAVSQVLEDKHSQDLVVGELLGRVDPVDVWKFIQSNYYPVFSTNSNIVIEPVKNSDQEVIYQARYPEGDFSNHPQRIIFKFFESENSLIAAIITEEVDFAITESYNAAEEVAKSTASYRVHFRYKNPNQVKMLAYNNRHYILKNPIVRQALTCAIDRSYILEKILGHTAYLADGPLSRESRLHISGLDEYKFNPRRAIQLLQQDSWKDSDKDDVLDKNGMPFRITIIYEKGVFLEEQLASQIKINWNKIGVDVIRKPLSKGEIKKNLQEGNYDVTLTSHIFEETIENLEAFFGATSNDNFLGYKSRRIDHLLSLSKIQQKSASKQLMLQAILKQINMDQPASFLFFLWVDRYFVNRNKFTNFEARGKLLPFTDWEIKD